VSAADWQPVQLSDVASFGSGTTPLRARKTEYFEGGTIPWVKTLDLNNGSIASTDESVTRLALEQTNLRVHPVGSVLVAMYGGFGQIGRTGVLRVPATTNQAITSVIPAAGKLHPDFLLHILNHRVRYWRSVASSSRKDPNITKDDVRTFPLQLPPFAEQEVIAAAISAADDFISSLELGIAKKRDIRRGLLQELLTGRTRLPGFDADWREALLGDHVSYVRTVALSREQLDQESPLRYLHYGDIHTRSNVRLDAAAESMPRARAGLASCAGRLAPGDVVFADASEDPAGVGKSVEITAVPPEGAVPGLHTIAARFDKNVLADGYKAYLQFVPAFREALLRLAAGTKVLATTRKYISSVRLMLPDVEEQMAIAAVLLNVDAEIEALQSRLESARAIKTGMMQELLTGRTRLAVAATS
jgi:type I restriction enzyme S subunit